MKQFLFTICFAFGFPLAMAQVQEKVSVLKYEDLEQKIKGEHHKTLVINFWATTCAPCVKELPHFMEVNNKNMGNSKYKMLLVSLDRVKDLPKVLKFIKDKNLTAEVVLLDDVKRMNTWIPRFEKDWQGEMPVTLFYQNGEKKYFHNGEMSKNELEETLKKYLN